MNSSDALDRISELLEVEDDAKANTSMRLPRALRDAAAIAVQHLGVSSSTTALTVAALRSALETEVLEAALNDHYREHPGTRPTLAEIALALAAQDGSPLAEHPRLIEHAAAEVLARHPDAGPDDVLLWAEAQQAVPT